MTIPEPRFTDADVQALPVDAGLAALFEELVQTPEAVALADPSRTPDRHRRRWPMLVAAAAAVAAAVGVPAYVAQRDGEAGSGAGGPAAAPSGSATATQAPATPKRPEARLADWTAPTSYTVLDAPGWSVDPSVVHTDPTYSVSFGYIHGNESFNVELIVAKWYRSVRDSAMSEGQQFSTIQVLGQEADYVEYESQQQMAYLPIEDGYGLRVEGVFTSPEEFRDLLTHLREVDTAGLVAALPEEIVTPSETADAVNEMLAGMEVPEGVDPPAVAAGFNDRSQLANPIVARAGCAWSRQFVLARRDGDEAARQQALDALVGSRRWSVLVDDIKDPAWFADTVKLMRNDGSGFRILASACPMPLTRAPMRESLPDLLEYVAKHHLAG